MSYNHGKRFPGNCIQHRRKGQNSVYAEVVYTTNALPLFVVAQWITHSFGCIYVCLKQRRCLFLTSLEQRSPFFETDTDATEAVDDPVRAAQELCESRDGCPGLPVPRSPYGLRGRKATFEE